MDEYEMPPWMASNLDRHLVFPLLEVPVGATALTTTSFAAKRLCDLELYRAGLKSLGLRVLGLEVAKPITRSRWDNPWLTTEQVQYAAIDAFLSYEIGRHLSSIN